MDWAVRGGCLFFAGFLVSSVVDLGAHGLRILRAAHAKQCALCLDEEGAPSKEEIEKVRVVLWFVVARNSRSDPSG